MLGCLLQGLIRGLGGPTGFTLFSVVLVYCSWTFACLHMPVLHHLLLLLLLPGPTNSGKTYTALQALAGAQRGVYCGPLRLLAMEVYETLNAAGVRCDMVTGQDVVRVPGAAHVSCTVEMASLYNHADVAVVDEIQVTGICGR
jgi:hypothetical protein